MTDTTTIEREKKLARISHVDGSGKRYALSLYAVHRLAESDQDDEAIVAEAERMIEQHIAAKAEVQS